MLGIDLETIRLFLHVLAATVWVGGQITLAVLVPALRGASPQAPRAAARAFSRVAWPAFGVLVLTGVWNVAAHPSADGAYRTTLVVKVAVVALSGVAALAHARARTRPAIAAFGALTGLTALAALFLGVLLG